MQVSVFGRRVREFMSASVTNVAIDTRVHEIRRLLVDGRHHSIAVVDDERRLLGTVSILELLRLVTDARDITTIRLPGSQDDAADEEPTARDALDPNPMVVTPDTTLVEAARLMHTQGAHRLFVVEAGLLVGAITGFDMLRAFTRGRPHPEQEIDLDPSLYTTGV